MVIGGLVLPDADWVERYLEASDKSIALDSIVPTLDFHAGEFLKHYGHIPIEVWESLTPRIVFND
jgi:hypothetical protein